jgi:hypothetical protein
LVWVVRVRALRAEQQPVPPAPLHRQVADDPCAAAGRVEPHRAVLEDDAAHAAVGGGFLALPGLGPARVEQRDPGGVVAGVGPAAAHGGGVGVAAHQVHPARRREPVLHGRVEGVAGAGGHRDQGHGHGHGGEAHHSAVGAWVLSWELDGGACPGSWPRPAFYHAVRCYFQATRVPVADSCCY